MRTYRDAKIIAKTLREEFSRQGVSLGHGECLDAVARLFGLDNWNVLAARINADAPPQEAKPLIPPDGWHIGGTRPDLYDIGIDPDLPCRSGRPALIRNRLPEQDPVYVSAATVFATLMQSVTAKPYKGRRVKLQADLRTDGVAGVAAIWLRIDGVRKTLIFDNMEGRRESGPLSGTHGWTERAIVLDVPEEAASIHFGFYLRGTGKLWAGGFRLSEAAAGETPTQLLSLLQEPTNLDFRVARPAA